MKALVFLAVLAFAAPAAAIPVNVALGKPVTLLGSFGNSTEGAWADPPPGPASLVTDGVFNPAHTNWTNFTGYRETELLFMLYHSPLLAAVLPKPYEPVELIRLVKSLLASRVKPEV